MDIYIDTIVEGTSIFVKLVAQAATTDPHIDYTLAWDVLSGIFPELDNRHRKTDYSVYHKNDKSPIKVIKDSPFDTIHHADDMDISCPSISIGDKIYHNKLGNGIVEYVGHHVIDINFNGMVLQFKYPQSLLDGCLKKL